VGNSKTGVIQLFSPNIFSVIKSRIIRWVEQVARMRNRRGPYRVSMGRPAGKKPLGRPNRRWKDNIKMDLLGLGLGGMDWNELAQDADRWWELVNSIINSRFFIE
jgi:hypothetical protein